MTALHMPCIIIISVGIVVVVVVIVFCKFSAHIRWILNRITGMPAHFHQNCIQLNHRCQAVVRTCTVVKYR